MPFFEQKKNNRLAAYTGMLYLGSRNLLSAESLCDRSTSAVVSMTSHGCRVKTVHHTIESIGRGHQRPSRLILWLAHEDMKYASLAPLRRLITRGLEVFACEDTGPHKKYHPYVHANPSAQSPLITADDDVIYPRNWLQDLLSAHVRHPEDIICHRALSMQFNKGQLKAYKDWPLCDRSDARLSHLATGVSGVLYPANFLPDIRARGDGFKDACPRADDLWLHSIAVAHQRRTRQVRCVATHFPEIPSTRSTSLHRQNVGEGGNDLQLKQTHSPEIQQAIRLEDKAR